MAGYQAVQYELLRPSEVKARRKQCPVAYIPVGSLEWHGVMDAHGRADVETMKMDEPEGIGGWNPLKYASTELGRQIVEFCAARIGRKAVDVLAGRIEPPEKADKGFMDNPGPTD